MEEKKKRDLYQSLRDIECDAYRSVVTAFRSQGEISVEKQNVLSELKDALHVSKNRHDIELLRTEQDQLVQRIVHNNISKYREEIKNGSLCSVYPPSMLIAPPPQPAVVVPELKKKAGGRRRSGFGVIPSPPPKRKQATTTRKRKRSNRSVNEFQPLPKKQKVPTRRKVNKKQDKKLQPQLPPVQPVAPLLPPAKVYPYAVDLTKLNDTGNVQNYIEVQTKKVDEFEKSWTDELDISERDDILSRVRSERFMLMQVLNHVENTL